MTETAGLPESFEDEDAGVQPWQVSDEVFATLELKSQPFAPATADGEWFSDDTTRAQLVHIKEALINDEDLLIVIGAEGSGKSVLLKQLSAGGGTRVQCFSVRGSERFNTANLFAGMLEAFKLKPAAKFEDILKDIVPCLQALAERNMLGVIVLDDADLVPAEEISSLLGSMQLLNNGEETLLRILMAAKPDFETHLPALLPSKTDLPYATLEIEPFDHARTAAYLNFRLEKAGDFSEFPFSERRLYKICEAGDGLPAGLNIAAAHEMNALHREPSIHRLSPVRKEVHRSPTQRPWKYAFGVLGVALIMASLYLFTNPKSPTAGNTDFTVLSKQSVTPISNEGETNTITLVQEPKTNILSADEAIKANSNSTTNNAQANGSSVAANQESSAESQNMTADSATVTTAQEPAASTATQKQNEPEAQAANPPASTAATEPAATPSTAAQQSQSEQSSPAQTRPGAETRQTSSSSVPLESANWVLVQDPELYTVQMSASRERASVEEFLNRSKLDGPNSIFSFKRGERTWYALVHGLYPTITEARNAIEEMPPAAKSNQPWIRAISQIQSAVKNQ